MKMRLLILVVLATGHYILHKFLANRTNFFAECCRKHHNLLIMRCHLENLLHISPHVCRKPSEYNENHINIEVIVQYYELTRRMSSQQLKIPSDSSILSHSSRMKCLTFFRESSLSLANASILPGVPTTMWGHSFFKRSL